MKTTPTTSGKTVVVGAYTFDQENARKELSIMVCLHEYPLSIVDHIGFRRFCNALKPLFKVITRNTLKSDILKLYNNERLKTMNVLERNKSRVAITTDMFIYVPAPHTAEVLSEVLVDCLMDWNLDRKDGLQLISHAIERVRDSVHYWTATPKREEKFKETCAQLKIPYTKNLCLDCKTRWNSTFLMLEVAIMYRDVFERLSLRESQYKSLPSEKDWDMADEIFQRLRVFFDVTELFSGTTYPTSNLYFPKVCVIKLALMEWKNCGNEIIEMMATSMITKFEKYWGVINTVMAIGTLLDPRYKMYLLNFFFRKIYGETEACVVIGQVKRVVQDLVLEYATKGRERDQAAQLDMPPPPSIPSSSKGRKFSHEDWQADFAAHVSEESAFIDTKSELDYYLEERPVPQTEHDFDILNWWKSNGAKLPTLQAIARDFLAIPISTVASESSFSTGGRFVTPHRSRLRPDTLEALMIQISAETQVPGGYGVPVTRHGDGAGTGTVIGGGGHVPVPWGPVAIPTCGRDKKKMHESILKIRNVVRYVRASPGRTERFKTMIKETKIMEKGTVHLDVPTRWNSTFLMHESALKFQKVFKRLGERDSEYAMMAGGIPRSED
ncbi:zinc finger BED domain-containing protein RICESLEEPER 2-like [Arachis hypogaea]|uniref:zinc finger BED domain-containing protein RICESLEEPER 2-like n=1 Tax=Arachis hypogaea TaxID=3818 RepID=UPI000DEE13B5|nr:zinc finger BED domain-containing protein RICESLEEPER 2-like [Arachis hypogaea]